MLSGPWSSADYQKAHVTLCLGFPATARIVEPETSAPAANGRGPETTLGLRCVLNRPAGDPPHKAAEADARVKSFDMR